MDNAGGTVPLGTAANAVSEYLERWPVQLGASYGPSAEAGERLDEARAMLASLFGSGGGGLPRPGQVAIGASTTSLLSRLSRAIAGHLRPGDEIVVTDADHEANIGCWLRLAERGIRIRTWSINRDSLRLEPGELATLLGARTKLVCFTHASNVIGSVTDLPAVVRMAQDCGARVCVDGVAYAPHRPIDVIAWGVDWYAFSAYKTFGPHCALLYSSPDALGMLDNLNHAWMSPTDAAGRLEPGAFPYELAWGAAAVPVYLAELGTRHDCDPFQVIAAQEALLCGRLLEALAAHPRVRIVGASSWSGDRLPTVSFRVQDRDPVQIVTAVDRARVGIRHGHFYAPRLLESLGIGPSPGVIRVSMVHYNTPEEVDRLLAALTPLL